MSTFDYSQFKKLDLHIHTPHSSCYSDMSVKPEQIVEAAVASGLDAIGITDHNSVAGVEDIRRIAERKNLIVFPGIELTTKGGHFLAIFEVDTAITKLEKLLDELGIARENRGDGTQQINVETEEIFKKVTYLGSVLIAAHIERWPSGFLETKESRTVKMSIHASPYLSALEITVAQNQEQWNNGEMRGYPKKYACIQGSDAHAPDEIGRRPILFRVNKISLDALKQTFTDWDNIIFFPDQLRTPTSY